MRVEELFKIALEYVNKYSIKAYVITFNPDAVFSHNIKLQGWDENNAKALDSLEFVFDEENNWYSYNHKGDNYKINITITKD